MVRRDSEPSSSSKLQIFEFGLKAWARSVDFPSAVAFHSIKFPQPHGVGSLP